MPITRQVPDTAKFIHRATQQEGPMPDRTEVASRSMSAGRPAAAPGARLQGSADVTGGEVLAAAGVDEQNDQ